ncbi:hypothetical protein HDU91_002563 [Kappamyces sp. JEL0680]|nr:hypothetical protein HDU91_002563 [Kappamyces sp. JEL0680]
MSSKRLQVLFSDQHKKISVAVLTSVFGLFLNFIAICIGQGEVQVKGSFNPLGLYWYYFFFYSIVVGSIIGCIVSESIPVYRLTLSVLIGLCLSYAPTNLEAMVQFANNASTANAGGCAVAGLLFFLLPLFPLLVWIGCDENAAINQLSLSQLPSFHRKPKLATPRFESSNTIVGSQPLSSPVVIERI